MENTFTLEQVAEWVDRNCFIGSPEAARTAMEDAESLTPLQPSFERALSRLQYTHRRPVTTAAHSTWALAYREMESRGIVKIEESSREGYIEVTLI